MASVRDFRGLYEYDWRVLRDFCDALEKLPEGAVLKDRGATHGSMKNVFFHILTVHDGWLNVTAQGGSADPTVYDLEDYDAVRTIGELRGYMEKVVAKERTFLDGLLEADLERPVQPAWKKRPHPLHDALMQVTFEQAHHIGELIAMFWQQDIEPPEMTWIDVRLAMQGDPGPS